MMKKLLVFVLTLALILSCAGCVSKTPCTAEEFTQALEAEGYKVHESSLILDFEVASYERWIADRDGCRFQFYIFDSKSDAKNIYAGMQHEMEREPIRSSLEVNLIGFSKYQITTKTKFYFVARIDNTLLFCDADKDCKDEALSVIKALGYN